MRKILLLATAVLFISIGHAQTTKRTNVQDAHDKYANQEVTYASTSKLPTGVKVKKGKIMLRRGFKAYYSDNEKILIITKDDGTITGAFTCGCLAGSGGCKAWISGTTIQCRSSGCNNCVMNTTVDPKVNASVTSASIEWKELDVKSRPKPEDPDQGGEIIKNRQKALPAKQ